MSDNANPESPWQGGPSPRSAETLIFVPVFNQRRELPGVLAEIGALVSEEIQFLIVNNGSSDGSEELIHQSRLTYLDVPRNRGVGYSYMLALDWALSREYEIFGTMASNGKMRPDEVPRLLRPIRAGEADYVSGSRFLEGGAFPNLPTFRRASIPFVNLIAFLTTGRRLTDATNGFRAFRLSWMRRAAFDWHAQSLWTYGLEYYLYAKFLRGDAVCVEVPSTMQYPETGPYTKIRPGSDWWAMIRPWFAALGGRGFE